MSEHARNLDTWNDSQVDDTDDCDECGGDLVWVTCPTCKGVAGENCIACDDEGDVCVCSECGETVEEMNHVLDTIHDAGVA